MNLSAIIDALIASGGTLEQVSAVVRAHEAQARELAEQRQEKKRVGNAERQRRKRENDRDSNACHGVTVVTERDERDTPAPPCLDKENPPAPPKEINPNPPLPPISVGSDKPNDNVVGLFGDIEGKSGKRKPANQKPAYSPLFGLVWETFPKHPNASKQQAFTEFQRLSEDDQNLALDGAMAFQEILAETRARNPKYDPPHLSTWLHQRRFDDALEAKPQFRMYKS